MKKIMLFAAACAALAACSKNIDTTSPITGDATAFEKGQKVTLTVRTGDQTKVTSSLDGSTGAVDFKWETGDMIKVTVGQASAQFTLSSGAGTATAEFTGAMPASGDKFNVQYPVSEPDLATQTYSATEAIPHDKMKFSASNCTVGTSFTLDPQNAVLRLNLYADVTIGKIVVTDKSASPEVSYTLTCTDGVKNNTGNETMPFFIVIPAGSRNFEAKVYGTGDTPALICTRTTTSAKTFEKGKILNMPLKYDYPGTDAQPISITSGSPATTTVWAPVNCGYDATNYKWGKLYQFGRAVGGGYNDSSTFTEDVYQIAETSASVSSTANTNPTDNVFYQGTDDSDYDWYITTGTRLSSWPIDSSHSQYVAGKIANPCPEGWRVPTMSELDRLAGGDGSGSAYVAESGWDSTNKGYWLNGTTSPSPGDGLFLPAAGYRHYYGGSANVRGNSGYYWSSSVNGDTAWRLSVEQWCAIIYSGLRANGYSVRCVQE